LWDNLIDKPLEHERSEECEKASGGDAQEADQVPGARLGGSDLRASEVRSGAKTTRGFVLVMNTTTAPA